MRLKIFMTICMLCSLVMVGIAQSTLQDSSWEVEKIGNSVNYYQKGDPIRYASSIIEKTDAEKQKIFEYAVANPDKVSPITYMALADYIYKTNKSEALFWYYVGSMRAYQDLRMCEDETNWAQTQIYPMLAPNVAKYSGEISVKEQNDLTLKALKWDEAHGRVNPQWACYHGLQNSNIKPMSEYAKHQQEFREKVLKSIQEK